jgi:hypothetical protein
VQPPVWKAPCTAPTGTLVIQDLPKLGGGLHSLMQTQVRQAS